MEEKKNLPFRVELKNEEIYGGKNVFVKDGVVWIIEPHIFNFMEWKYKKISDVKRLGIPLFEVEQIKQIEQKENGGEEP